jgi:L-ascorbate metabolism protein UlaG (beta-lactamase superfamily)
MKLGMKLSGGLVVLLIALTAYAAVRSDRPGQVFYGVVNVTTAAAVKVPTNCARDRNSLAVFNNGPNTIYCGGDSAVLTTTGFPIGAGSQLAIDVACNADGSAAIWCISATADQASPANTRVIEVR